MAGRKNWQLPLSWNRLRFGEFELDFEPPELWRGAERIDLPNQPLKVLVLLAKRQGQVVSSEEIRRAVWGNRVVSWPESLYVCIRQLRRAIGESANNQTVIQTVSRRGYRFVADVVPVQYSSTHAPRIVRWLPATFLTVVLCLSAAHFLLENETVSNSRSSIFAAYEAYEKGSYLLTSVPIGDLQLAADLFNEAVAADPQYTAAWIGLAEAYVRLKDFAAAESAVQHAMDLDSRSADALRLKGDIHFFRDWSVENAKSYYRQSLNVNSDSAKGHQQLAMAYAASGQTDQAIEHMERALALNPTSTIIHADLGWYYYLAGQLEQSITSCRTSLKLEPLWYYPHFCLLKTYIEQGNTSGALGEAKIILEAWDKGLDLLAGAQTTSLDAFWTEYLQILDEISQQQAVSPMDFAHAYAGMRNAAMTLHWLKIAFEKRDPNALFIPVSPAFSFLREHDEFRELMLQFRQHSH